MSMNAPPFGGGGAIQLWGQTQAAEIVPGDALGPWHWDLRKSSVWGLGNDPREEVEELTTVLPQNPPKGVGS